MPLGTAPENVASLGQVHEGIHKTHYSLTRLLANVLGLVRMVIASGIQLLSEELVRVFQTNEPTGASLEQTL